MIGTAFPGDLFDDSVLTLGGGIDYLSDEGKPSLRVQRRPPRLEFGQGECSVAITRVDGELRSTARTDEEHALVARMTDLLRESVVQARMEKAKVVAEFEKLAPHDSATFGRAEVDALLKTLGAGDIWDVEIGVTTASIWRGWWDQPARVRLRRGNRDVTIYLLDDTLRTSAATDEDRTFIDELGAQVPALIERLEAERSRRIAAAVAAVPTVDRETLVEALAALTHGRVDVQPIADAIMLASTDPCRYVIENAARCREFGISEPEEGLYVVALLSHIPSAHLAYFDWKDSLHDMIPELAAVLRAGPGIELDIERYRDRCDDWDRSRERIPALKKLAAEITGAALVELKQGGDAYAIACVPHDALPRLRTWNAKAHVPLRSLVAAAKAKPATKAVQKALAQATDVKPYAPSTRFAVGEIVEHPTFGRGQVVKVVDNKVMLRFGDSERTLLHAKA